MSALLTLRHLTVRRGAEVVLSDVNLTLERGEFLGLIGPNGAGKSTLLRAAFGLLPATGESSLAALPPARRARLAAWMPQGREIAWPVTVETLVMLGRVPHGSRGSERDHAAVSAALDRLALGHLRHRRVTELSGGEQARVLLARVLAQETPLLLADEPTAGLDPAAQIGAMEIFGERARVGGVIVALHDLGLAARHCTRLVLLDKGGIVADGPPDQVLTAENLARVFGIRAWFQETAEGPVFQPLSVL